MPPKHSSAAPAGEVKQVAAPPAQQVAAPPAQQAQASAQRAPAAAQQSPAHPAADAHGTVGNRAVQAAFAPVAAQPIRKLKLRKAERVLDYLLADGSTYTARLISFCDFPPGTYWARALPGERLRWLSPPELSEYLTRSGRHSAVTVLRVDHEQNPGTFEGVGTFEFEVIGPLATTAGPAAAGPAAAGPPAAGPAAAGPAAAADVDPDAAAILESPRMRRLMLLRKHAADRPAPSRPAALRGPAPKVDLAAEIDAMRQVDDLLARFNGTDWELLERRALVAAPAATWAEERDLLERYLRSGDRDAAVSDATTRDARLAAAGAAIDPDREARAVARLAGTQQLYDAIRLYERLPSGSGSKEWRTEIKMKKDAAERAMKQLLERERFDDVEDFDAAVKELRVVVGRRAVLLALTSMRESERVLKDELTRYGDRATLNRLATELRNLVRTEDGTNDGITRVLDAYPLLRDPVVFKGALAAGIPDYLGDLLRQNAEAQLGNVERSRAVLADDPEAVFSFDLVIDRTLEAMQLSPTTAQARLIREKRGKKRSVARAIFDMVVLVLSFATGPLGWLGYLANLTSFVLHVNDVREQERQRDIQRSAAHTGTPLATPPPIGGSTLDAVTLLAEGFGVAHLPAPRAPSVPSVPSSAVPHASSIPSAPSSAVPHGPSAPSAAATPPAPSVPAAPAPHAPGAAAGGGPGGPLIVDLQSGPMVGTIPALPDFGAPAFLPQLVESIPGARGVAIEGGDFLLGYNRNRVPLFGEAERVIPGVYPVHGPDLALSRQYVQVAPQWPSYTPSEVGGALARLSDEQLAAAPFVLRGPQLDPTLAFPTRGRVTILREPRTPANVTGQWDAADTPSAFFPALGGPGPYRQRLVPLDQRDVVTLQPSTHPQLHGRADQIYWRRPFGLASIADNPAVTAAMGAEINRMLKPGGFVEFRVLRSGDVRVVRALEGQIAGARVVEVPQAAIDHWVRTGGQRRPGLTDEQWQILTGAAPDLAGTQGALGAGAFNRIIRIYRGA
jgi:hypothetical protein